MKDAKTKYKEHIYNGLPMYQTKLVRMNDTPYKVREQMKSPDDVHEFLIDYFDDKDKEHFVAVLVDTANTIIGMVLLSIGDLTSASASPRAVFKSALLANASAVILAHNHPSGNPEPSRADLKITREIAAAGELMGIPVHDHVICTPHDCTSLASRGVLD